MQIENKVTKLCISDIDEIIIQNHLNEQNVLGYYLIAVDNQIGWYRFFWAKQAEQHES